MAINLKIPQIGSIHTPHLTNNAHFQYMDTVSRRMQTEAKIQANPQAREASEALAAALAEEDRCYRLSQKMLITDEIKAADEERDRMFSGYRAAVKGFLNAPLSEVAQAAKVLNQHLKDYKISVSEQLEKETAAITNLVDDLETKYSAEVTRLGIGFYVTALKTENLRVRDMLETRTDDKSRQVVGALRAARTQTDAIYQYTVQVVNALAVVGTMADYVPLIDYMNQLIKRYKEQVLHVHASAGGGSSSDGGSGSDSGDSGSGGSSSGGSGGSSSGGSGSGGSSGGGGDTGGMGFE